MQHCILKLTFMGCTGSGTPKMMPVMTLKVPEKTSVLSIKIEPWSASAIINGSNVPRSPNAPEISAKGAWRMASTLCRWIFFRCDMNDMTRIQAS